MCRWPRSLARDRRTEAALISADEQRGAIGVWGAFDADVLGAQLRMRVVVSELARRRPDCSVRAFAPFGGRRPFPADSGEPIEALDDSFGARGRELAAGLGLVVVSVDLEDLFDRDPAALDRLLAGPGSPVRLAWHALGVPSELTADTTAALQKAETSADRISLLSDGSAGRWAAHGGRSPDAEVPHPALLARRVFEPDVLAARREFLRAIDAFPRDEQPIVIQGAAADRPAVAQLCVALTGHSIVAVIADAAAGDAAFADAVVGGAAAARRLPDDAGVEDRVAAIAGAAGVIAASPIVRAVARAFGVPHGALDTVPARLEPPESIAPDVSRLDDDLDALAQLAPGPHPGPLAWSELAALRAALDARGRRLAAERIAMADAVFAARERVAPLEHRVAELEAAYQDVRNLEVVRWRVALGNLRTRLHLRPKR